MPATALALALIAAFVHALWNILLARARDIESSTAVALITAELVFAPVVVFTWEAHRAVWPFLDRERAAAADVLRAARDRLPAGAAFGRLSDRARRCAGARAADRGRRARPDDLVDAGGRRRPGRGGDPARARVWRRRPARRRVRARDRLVHRRLHAGRQGRRRARGADHVPRAVDARSRRSSMRER